METFKIDDVSKECGLTKRTIRYYEEIGLLPPPERSEGGIRLYKHDHIERLKKIGNAREVLGFSLQEIQQFVTAREKLEQHQRGYKENIDEDYRKQRLIDIEKVLAQQLQMIDYKLETMVEFRKDIGDLHKRVEDLILNKQQEKE